jgi:hypothetical protein
MGQCTRSITHTQLPTNLLIERGLELGDALGVLSRACGRLHSHTLILRKTQTKRCASA